MAVGCGIFWQFPRQRRPQLCRIWARGPSYGSGRDPDILAGRLWPAARSCKFHFPIQAPILYGFADVGRAELRLSGQVGDGPRDLEHAMIRPRGQVQPGYRLPQHCLDRFDQPAMPPQVSGAHVRVGVDAALLSKSNPLDSARPLDPAPDSGAGFSR